MNRGAVLAVVALGLVLTLGAIAPGVAPVVVATPDSGSMVPTAQTHSLVVVVDTEPSVGDVALFETPTRDQAVLHRLVDRTPEGDAFITKGDANAATDQAAGDPPVSPDQVYGTVPTLFGHPLVVPYAGLILTNPVVGFGAWALLGASLLYTTTGGQAVRETVASVPVRVHVVVLAVAIMVVIPVAAVVAPASVTAEVVTTTTASGENPAVVQPGEVGERTIRISSPVIWGLQTTAEAEGDLRIRSVEATGGGTRTVTVVNEPTAEPGVQRGTITVYSFPATLPKPVLDALVDVHPVVAGFASALPIGGSVLVAAMLFIDPRLPLRASRTAIQRRRRRTHADTTHFD
jgi:signal peptidase